MNSISFAAPDITEVEVDAVSSCLRHGWLTAGPMVERFERAFAERVGAKEALACSSATMATTLILQALGVGPGDEVIVPAWTFSGPAMAAVHLGATVVLADVDRRTFNLTAEKVAPLVTRQTRVVMPTHFAGLPVDLSALLALGDDYGIEVVDDAAHAFPASTVSGWVGAQGALATFFSFYATKPICTGDGGMITTPSPQLAEAIRKLRCHGMSREAYGRYTDPGAKWRYEIVEAGWKANMTDIEAALGLVQLRRAEELLSRRWHIAGLYARGLANLPVQLPVLHDGHALHLFPILVERDRDGFIERMAARGVQCSMHFIPLHQHAFWKSMARCPLTLPNADYLAAREVSLPMFSKMTDADVERVISAVKDSL